MTVCLPVNAHEPSFLRQAVRSIVDQSCGAWELLVVAEVDVRERVQQLLAPYLADRRLCILDNEGRKLAGAFNTGMRHAAGEFVAILLGDDLWAANAVEVLTRSIRRHPGVDFFHSARMIVDEHGRPLSGVHPAAHRVRVEDFVRSSPVKHLLCWRRELGLAIGGMDESLDSVGVDDYDFPWSMAEHGAIFRALPDCLYVYRDHRACYRLTTHLPLAHHRREIARIMAKHGSGSDAIERKLANAQASYLRQCLYRTSLDRRLKEWRGYDPRLGWREAYR